VGLAGVQGNGQSELVEVIAGLRGARGLVVINGKDVSTDNLRKRRESGLAIIPEKRKEQGLNLTADIATNVIATRYYKNPFSQAMFLKWDKALEFGEKIIERFNIKAENPKTIVNTLSGGNRQKVIAGRELIKNPEVIIAAYPTRGLDVLSAQFVHEELIHLRDSGSAILLISADLDEIFAISDRILVIYEGRIIGEKLPDQTSFEEIGLLMAGHNE
jgi:simple sugar transport system ATP-binding protein